MANSLSKEEFIDRANKAHGSRYSYDKSMYVNMRKPITIVCTTHGEFKQSPMNHLKTEGCPKCGYESRHKKPEPKKEDINFTLPNDYDDEDTLLMNSVMNSFKKFHKDFKVYVNPITKESYTNTSKPIPSDIQQSIIPLTASILENADTSGMIIYDDIDTDALDAEISKDGLPSNTVRMVKRVVKADWNSIALNPTFTIGDLVLRKSKIEIDYIIHSPAFLSFACSKEFTKQSGILTLVELISMINKYPKIMDTIRLADDWFLNESDHDILYTSYIIPRLLNYGHSLSKVTTELFKTRIIEFSIRYVTTVKDTVSMSKIPTLLSSLPELIFMTVFTGLNGCVLRKQYLEKYMTSNYISDKSLEILLSEFGSSFYKLISTTQVPSLKFIRKHRESLDGILILRSMVRNGRIFNSYIEEFIDDLLEYTKKRSELLGNLSEMRFTGNESSPYVNVMDVNSGIQFDLDQTTGSLFESNKTFNYTDYKTCDVSTDYVYYKEDMMKNIYLKTNNKIFKALYESLRLDNPKNNDMIASIQSELETLLNNSKILQDKLKKFKKAI